MTGVFNTLHSQYNQLAEEERAVVDSLMEVDWDTGSIRVAQNDVVALADAFGMSAASLQQALDLIETYSDYSERDLSSVSSDIQSLNDATYKMNQTMDDSARSTANAWDELTKAGDIGAKQALEALTEGMDVDVTEMTVAELNSLVEALNAFKAQVGSDMSIEGI